MARFKKLTNLLYHPIWRFGLFWSWNVIFIVFIVFLEAQEKVFSNILVEIFWGKMPWDFGLFSLLLLVIPICCVTLAATKLQKKPEVLLRLFYGVEVPLMLVCLLRLMVFRELNPSSFHFILLGVTGMLFYLWDVIYQPSSYRKSMSTGILIGHGVLLLIGTYAAMMALFYAIPIGFFFIKEFFQFQWISEVYKILIETRLLALLFLLLFTYTATILVALPIVLPFLYISSFFKHFTRHKHQFSKEGAWIIAIASIVGNLVMFVIFNYSQRQTKAFELLALSSETIEGKQEQLAQSNAIRQGLLHAYVSSYRYLGDTETNTHIEEMYEELLGVGDSTAHRIQEGYNFLATPFLYRGKMWKDKRKASALYETFFDTPIQKGERTAINRALHATWNRTTVEAGLLDQDKETVLLVEQALTVEEHDTYADIELKETYLNQTFTDQEIFYYFSLPEQAVITGLWLSDEEDVPKKYAPNVSPRGAAQEVYKRQLERRVDPSLLEQVGPRQYRLRAFPIPSNRLDYRYQQVSEFKEGDPFYLWMRIRTIAQEDGQWIMPELLEKRNVYWEKKTVRTINGQVQPNTKSWLPARYEAERPLTLPETFTISLSDEGDSFIQVEKKVLDTEKHLPKDIALVIDRSYSMNARESELKQVLIQLYDVYHKKDLDVYLGGYDQLKLPLSTVMDELYGNTPRKHMIFYGSSQPLELLSDMQNILGDRAYEAMIMLTDQGSYELAQDSSSTPSFQSPLFLFHIDGQLPKAYPDQLLEFMYQHGGNSVTSVDQLTEALSLTNWKQSEETIISYEDGYVYGLAPTLPSVEVNELAPLAAHQMIMHHLNHSSPLSLALMDKIHAIAKTHSIVSPFSSMIVLVNDRQKKELEEAEKREDRFDREVEHGKEQMTTPTINMAEEGDIPNGTVNGTPEPEEWMLIVLVVSLIGWMYWRK